MWKRTVFLILFALGSIAATYFSITRLILPNIEQLNVWHYILIAGIVISFIGLGSAIITFANRNKDKRISLLDQRLKQWTNLSVHINRAGDEVFKHLPIGIIVFDEDLKVRWVNNYSKDIFKDEIMDASLEDLGLGLGNYVQDKINIIKIGERYFEIKQNDEDHIIYLFDVTKQEVISQKYNDKTLAIGILTLDNIEMETKKFDMQESAQIHGDFIGEIVNWAHKYNAYIKDFDDNSFIVVLDKINFNSMIENKFDILNKIRDISSKNNIRVTLSIGFACGDIDVKELGQNAQSAIDLAEKRGGDQVVVNVIGQKIQYFGARTNALEKNNLLAARAYTLALKDQVEAASEVYIMGHNKADADALGAAIGVLKMVLTSKKPTKLIVDYYKIDETCKKMYNEIEKHEPDLMNYFINDSAISDVSENALLIMVDTQSIKLAMNEELLFKFRRIALIDHHRTSDEGFGETVFQYVEPAASSTVELVTEMFQFYQKDGIYITPFEATLMLAGVVVDTNNFTFRTGARTFEVSSTLKANGADMIEIRRLLRNDLETQITLTSYLQKAEIILNKFAVCEFDEFDVITDRTILAKVAEMLLTIEGVEAAFVMANYEENDTKAVAISARSYQDINVQVIMEEMGGGGHLNAAAVQIKDITLDEAKTQVINVLKRDYEAEDVKMKVILKEDIKGRGKANEVIEVASGYGNYLVTNKKAVIASDENLNALKEELKHQAEEEALQKRLMLKIKEDIENKSVNIYIKVGADGKLFGHVTTKQIVEEFEAQTGIHLDKKKVSLPVEIGALGTYQAVVDLHKDVKASFEVNVLEK